MRRGLAAALLGFVFLVGACVDSGRSGSQTLPPPSDPVDTGGPIERDPDCRANTTIQQRCAFAEFQAKFYVFEAYVLVGERTPPARLEVLDDLGVRFTSSFALGDQAGSRSLPTVVDAYRRWLRGFTVLEDTGTTLVLRSGEAPEEPIHSYDVRLDFSQPVEGEPVHIDAEVIGH